MAYTPHIYVAIGGRLGGSEQWQTGFRLWSASDNDLATLDQRASDSLVDIEAHVQTWWSAIAGVIPTSMHWDFTKVNSIGPDGRYGGAQTHAIYYDEAQAGNAGNGVPGPYQVAWCLSLMTDAARGLASRGRMYIPARTLTTNAVTGQATSTDPSALQNATAALFTNINDNPGLDVSQTRVAIMSEQGPHRDVVGVRCGLVPDTQRRRRRGLVEDYLTATAVTGQG